MLADCLSSLANAMPNFELSLYRLISLSLFHSISLSIDLSFLLSLSIKLSHSPYDFISLPPYLILSQYHMKEIEGLTIRPNKLASRPSLHVGI